MERHHDLVLEQKIRQLENESKLKTKEFEQNNQEV